MMKNTALLLLALLATSPLAAQPADLVLKNGHFYRVSTPGKVAGSLAVREGRIVYLGPDAGLGGLIGDGTEIVELAGRTVTPGLIDAHSHLVSQGAALERVDLVGTTSFSEVIDRIRAAAELVPEGQWIQGRGWDQNDWPEKRFPHHRKLSDAVPNHPVWVGRVDGHAILANQKAMEMLGVSAASVDPVGGRFERAEDGNLTGVLVDTATAVGAAIPAPTPADLERQILAGAEHCLSLGLTTVTEMGVGPAEIEAYRALRRSDRLPIRTALFLTDNRSLLEHWFERGPEIDPEARLQVRGIKLYSDGALGSRGAAMIEPYSDDPSNLGLLITGGDHMRWVCEKALDAGFQVGTHAIGDRGNLVTLDAFATCFGGEPKPEARFRVEHAQIMRLGDIERMAELGVIASVQPTHATSDMPWAEDRVGSHRILGGYAWRKVLEAGGRIALGSDFPVELADPRLGLFSAVSRQDHSGHPAGGWYPDQRLTPEEALRGFTLDAAYSLFLEDEVGSLDIGKRADLVVFAEDIVATSSENIPSTPIDMTLVDGEIVYRRQNAP